MTHPLRIHITGNSGAGKSTLARALGEALDLPVFFLDRIVWQSGWRKTPPDERRELEVALIEQPGWIIEGVSARVREAADWVIYLDVSRSICLWRGIRRSLRYLHRTRPELPAGCPEWRIIPRQFGIIRRFPSRAGAEIEREAERDPERYSIIRRPGDLASILACIPELARLHERH